MIEKETVKANLQGILEDMEVFLVDIKVDSNNRILVYVDKMEGISIDDCVRVSRALEAKLDRDMEDFALEVSSPGLDAPFRVLQQYEKSIGKMVSVQCTDGSQHQGLLKEADEKGIRLEIPAGKKGGEPERQLLSFTEIKSTRIHIKF